MRSSRCWNAPSNAGRCGCPPLGARGSWRNSVAGDVGSVGRSLLPTTRPLPPGLPAPGVHSGRAGAGSRVDWRKGNSRVAVRNVPVTGSRQVLYTEGGGSGLSPLPWQQASPRSALALREPGASVTGRRLNLSCSTRRGRRAICPRVEGRYGPLRSRWHSSLTVSTVIEKRALTARKTAR